jgi:hypothetical protein
MGVYVSGTIWMDGRRPVVTQAASADPAPPASGPTWDPNAKATGVDLSADKLTASTAAESVDLAGLATAAITAGQKVRIEFLIGGTDNHVAVGFGNASISLANDGNSWLGSDDNGIGYYSDGRIIGTNGGQTYATYDETQVVDIDIDFDAGTAEFFVDGVSQGTPIAHGITGDLYAALDLKLGAGSSGVAVTLVQPGSFTHAPPTGFTKYGA